MPGREYAKKVEEWSKNELWSQTARRMIHRFVLSPDARVLDFGGNTGQLYREMRELNLVPDYVLADSNHDALLSAPYDAYKVLIQNDRYPSIVPAETTFCFHALSHVSNPIDAFVWMARHTTKYLVFVYPNRWHDRVLMLQNKFSGYRPDPTYKHHVKRRKLNEWAKPLGLVEVYHETLGRHAYGIAGTRQWCATAFEVKNGLQG